MASTNMIESCKLESQWNKVLRPQFELGYMKDLGGFLASETKKGKTIFPPISEVFTAFNHAPFKKVRVVIIGQDPYHGDRQAHGLSFSVKTGVKIPPSLRNIYKEIESDLKIEPAEHGCLNYWAKQGVLLLNAVLTVEASKAASHQKKGWEKFTDQAIQTLNEKKENLVFILWGASAQKKGAKIDRSRHLVLESVHPSPLSAYRGFFGSRPFSKTNAYLKKNKLDPIDWSLPND